MTQRAVIAYPGFNCGAILIVPSALVLPCHLERCTEAPLDTIKVSLQKVIPCMAGGVLSIIRDFYHLKRTSLQVLSGTMWIRSGSWDEDIDFSVVGSTQLIVIFTLPFKYSNLTLRKQFLSFEAICVFLITWDR